MKKMELLSKDILGVIASYLELKDILNLCISNTNFERKIGQNKDFWNRKLKQDYNIDTRKIYLQFYQEDLRDIKEDVYSIRDKKQTRELCLAAVKRQGRTLKYIKNQTEEICLAAVQENRKALKYVKNQTEEMCLIAVSRDGFLLKYVKNQTVDICMAAIRSDSPALSYVDSSLIEEVKSKLQSEGYDLKFYMSNFNKINI